MRHILLFLSGLLLTLNYANAGTSSRKNTETVKQSDCSAMGDSPYHKVCHEFENGDAVHIKAIHPFDRKQTQFNLFITDGRSSHDLLVPIDSLHPEYDVAFPIEINYTGTRNLFGDKKRRSLIYRLNYTDHLGNQGFQIITLRLNNFLQRRKGTCTMGIFDSQTFAHVPARDREAEMRKMAHEIAGQTNFVSRD